MSVSPEPVADRLRSVAAKIHDRAIRVGPRVPLDAIIGFERRYGIALPSDYREFLLQIGDGASGPPYYGLVPLFSGEAPPARREHQERSNDALMSMSQGFPFTRTWIWERGDKSDEGTNEQLSDGRLYLGTDGCGMDWYLILTGPERGNIWMISGEGITPTYPKGDFLRWFEDWVDGVRDWWTADGTRA